MFKHLATAIAVTASAAMLSDLTPAQDGPISALRPNAGAPQTPNLPVVPPNTPPNTPPAAGPNAPRLPGFIGNQIEDDIRRHNRRRGVPVVPGTPNAGFDVFIEGDSFCPLDGCVFDVFPADVGVTPAQPISPLPFLAGNLNVAADVLFDNIRYTMRGVECYDKLLDISWDLMRRTGALRKMVKANAPIADVKVAVADIDRVFQALDATLRGTPGSRFVGPSADEFEQALVEITGEVNRVPAPIITDAPRYDVKPPVPPQQIPPPAPIKPGTFDIPLPGQPAPIQPALPVPAQPKLQIPALGGPTAGLNPITTI